MPGDHPKAAEAVDRFGLVPEPAANPPRMVADAPRATTAPEPPQTRKPAPAPEKTALPLVEAEPPPKIVGIAIAFHRRSDQEYRAKILSYVAGASVAQLLADLEATRKAWVKARDVGVQATYEREALEGGYGLVKNTLEKQGALKKNPSSRGKGGGIGE